MKTIIKAMLLLSILYILNIQLYAQPINIQKNTYTTDTNNQLEPYQNPRHMESMKKYVKSMDSLTKLHGITIQQTYKAYDWYEEKMEKKAQQAKWRHQERMERAKNSRYNYNYGFDSWGWSGYYNNYYSSPWWGINPYINYRWNNWNFGLIF